MNDAEEQSSRNVSSRVAYIVLRFPTLSETFVVSEISSLRARGWDITIYPLWRDKPSQTHANVQPLLSTVRWSHPLSLASIRASIRMCLRRPGRCVSAVALILRDFPRRPRRAVISLGLFPVMVWMATELERQGVRHVHAHFASYPTLAALVVRRLTGISYSFTAHAYDLYVDPSHLANKVNEASFVVTISEYNRSLLSRLAGSRTPLHVIHCGVSLPACLPERLPGGSEIVCVARLEEKKGHRYLIDACGLLRQRGVSLRCTIVGGGPELTRLRAQVTACGLEDVVELVGPKTSERVQEHLSRAVVFALPSVVTSSGNAEGIPVALMEAMGAGVPVVSTTTTGIPELVVNEQTGLLVPPRDAEALADAIERLLSEPELRNRLRVAAFNKVRKEFRIDLNAQEIERHLCHAVSAYTR